MMMGWILIVFLAGVLAISSVLPRSAAEMTQFAENNGTAMEFFINIGFYDKETFLFALAEAWWFKGLIALILLFLLKGSLKLLWKTLYWLQNYHPKTAGPEYSESFQLRGSVLEACALIEFKLQKLGYKTEVSGEKFIVAKKGRGFYGSLLLIHVSLLILGISGIYHQTVYKEGELNLPEGKKITSEQIQGLSMAEGLAFKAESLWPEYYPIDNRILNGQIKEYFVKVRILKDDDEEVKVVSTSRPISLGAYKYFLTGYGANGVISVIDEAGRETLEVFPIQINKGFLSGSFLSKNNVAISVTYGGFRADGQKEELAYYIYDYIGNRWQRVKEGQSKIGEAITFNGKQYVFQEVKRVGVIKVIRAANPIPFYLGMLGLTLGSGGFLYFKKITLEVEINAQGIIQIEAWYPLANYSLKRELKELEKTVAGEVT